METSQAYPDRIPFAVWIVVLLMALACAGANWARSRLADLEPVTAIGLERAIPDRFGDWRREPRSGAQVVNPQAQELSDRLYSETLVRTYVDSAGYRIMLSIAYGSDQRGALQAHRPEICYPAQGFALHGSVSGEIATPGGAIPVRRLLTSRGPRKEPVTYWLTVGEQPVRTAMDHRIAVLKSTLAGRMPDGLLFRVSSIDADARAAQRLHETFIEQLLAALAPGDRARLSGLIPY